MPDISSIGHGSIGPINRATARSAPQATVQPLDRVEAPGDRVELSQHARLLDRIRQLPEVRGELIDRIRNEIEAGTYETPDRIEAAIQGIIAEIRGEMI